MKSRYLTHRLIQSLVVLIGVVLLIFVMLRVIPGNPVEAMMGEHADADTIARMTREMGLDQPILVQFFRYIASAVRGDFGTSYSLGKPVSELIGGAFVNTLVLAVFASLFAWIFGIGCGIVSAMNRNRLPDRLFMGVSLLGISLPVFMAAMFLQYFFAFKLGWFPISGTDSWTGFILPAVALGWNAAGQVAQLTRTALLEALQEDYIDTARAKGRSSFAVLVFHALRNAMLPVMTVMAIQFSGLLSGAVITETVFSINGIGRLMIQGISGRDIPLLQGTALLATSVVILGSLLADCLYAVLDPRIRLDSTRVVRAGSPRED